MVLENYELDFEQHSYWVLVLWFFCFIIAPVVVGPLVLFWSLKRADS